MTRFPLPLLTLLPLLMSACAAPPATQTVAAADEGVVCEQSSRTGSNMISKHCRSAAQREKDKSDTQEFGDKIRRTGGTVDR